MISNWQALIQFEKKCYSYSHLIELTPLEMVEFAQNCEQANGATNEVLTDVVEYINKILSRAYGDNGMVHYKTGMEHSRVIYVHFRGGMVVGDKIADETVEKLRELPKMFPMDEFNIQEERDWIIVRMWWD